MSEHSKHPKRLIDTIKLPDGLRDLSIDNLQKLSQELREELIESVSMSGGHFASSLGATEIAVALHHAFDTPNDRIVWDIGHQAYIHKILTGRRHAMSSIRKKGGISGFLKRTESEYDTFGAGHAGTSLSAAVGMSAALQKASPEKYVVAVIGDASITCGMAFEALNHAGGVGLKNFIVVLNDNEMSISPNVGALSYIFSHAVTSKTSTKLRAGVKTLYQHGYVPEIIYKAMDRAEEVTQGFFSGASMLFESFGFRYIGPVDGHNVGALVTALRHAREQDCPVLIHTYTTKGKGYEPAEQDPVTWHGVAPFDRDRGLFLHSKSSSDPKPPSYTAVFGDTLCEIAKKDPQITAITAAMTTGTGLEKFHEQFPDSFYDVGICEQHAVTFAAGLACEGYKPVCAIYSSFLQRGYDQVLHDVCIQNLPVVFAIDRAGLVGNDGETHHGVFDIAFLRTVPNITIMSPKNEEELRHMLFTAVNHSGPVALRYPRGLGTGVAQKKKLQAIPIGKAEVLRHGSDVLFIAFGPIINQALLAAATLDQFGISSTVINARFAKPLDETLLALEIPKHRLVCTIEDHALSAGFGSAVVEFANDAKINLQAKIERFGIGDVFVSHADQSEQYEMLGMDSDAMVERVLRALKPTEWAQAI